MAKIDRVQEVSIELLRPYERNAKIHGEDQIDAIKRSIKEFGFISPCLIDKDFNIIAGHGRVIASKQLGLKKIPCVFIEGLTEEQKKAYILADNRLTEMGGWDQELIDEELKALYDSGFDISLTGFELNLDDEMEEPKDIIDFNPTAALPDSRVLVCSVSAFGTNTERFIEVPLSQDEADRFLKRVEEMEAREIADKFRGLIDAL